VWLYDDVGTDMLARGARGRGVEGRVWTALRASSGRRACLEIDSARREHKWVCGSGPCAHLYCGGVGAGIESIERHQDGGGGERPLLESRLGQGLTASANINVSRAAAALSASSQR